MKIPERRGESPGALLDAAPSQGDTLVAGWGDLGTRLGC